MGKVKDLKGQKFGRLTVVEFIGIRPVGSKTRAFWKCQCNCGKIIETSNSYLSSGDTKSCGCISNPEKNQHIEETKKRLIETSEINENGCWIWKGYRCEPKKLYGLTSISFDGPKRKILSHRLSYILWKGEIPNDLFVLHSCDVPLCINPDHLNLGTHQKNMDEMMERDRKNPAKGERNRHAKLTEDQVRLIKEMHFQGESNSDLCKEFNIASSTMSYILRGITWKHLLEVKC